MRRGVHVCQVREETIAITVNSHNYMSVDVYQLYNTVYYVIMYYLSQWLCKIYWTVLTNGALDYSLTTIICSLEQPNLTDKLSPPFL